MAEWQKLFPQEAADPDCIDPAAAIDMLRGAPWRRMVVLGDSVAAGVRDAVPGYVDEAFANRVGDTLVEAADGFTYRNLAVPQLRLAEIRDQQLTPALAEGPDLALIVGGGNDALGKRFAEERIRRGLEEIVLPLAEAGAYVVTIGMFDIFRSGLIPDEYALPMIERFDRLDAITAEVAEAVGGHHVDTHRHPRAADPAIFASDLMHATTRGHAIAYAAIVRDLAAITAALSARRP